MAGFTSNSRVLAMALHVGLVRMTRFTSLASGELDGMGPDVIERSRPEVAILAELSGNHSAPYQQKRNHAESQQEYYTEQVLNTPEKVLHVLPSVQFRFPTTGGAAIV
jgi:hypothetical protein